MAVAGASRYLNSAILANIQGRSPSIPSVLAEGSALSLLSAGKNAFSQDGIGLSASSRQRTEQYLSSNQSSYNSLFSLGVGAGLTGEGLVTQILALRSKFNDDQVSSLVQVNEEVDSLKAQAEAIGLGSLIDEEV